MAKIAKLLTSSVAVFTLFLLASIAASAASVELTDVDTLEGYEYVELSEPRLEMYDGKTEVLLGYLQPINTSADGSSTMDYREYDTWKVYDQGIIQSWSYLSNPYFIKSIARGMVYEKTTEVSATISATYEGSYPSAAKSAINAAFKLSGSGTKKVTEKVTFSGPDAGYNSRDFYYQHGRHTNQIRIVQEHRSNWDGILWTKTYYGTVGDPKIRTFSQDTNR
ncbi:hypothetical protein ABE073_01620 [Lederbergia citrisecunda]|uniref:hypothetical protein n=1 Tax=Lederbergia citrisecunda TaxID=2833583 RepID=UPI003D2911B0